jgi:hypothetical protein
MRPHRSLLSPQAPKPAVPVTMMALARRIEHPFATRVPRKNPEDVGVKATEGTHPQPKRRISE